MAKTQANYPTSLDSLTTDRASGDTITSASYDVIEDAITEIEAKIGANNSAVSTTIEYGLNMRVLPVHPFMLMGA